MSETISAIQSIVGVMSKVSGVGKGGWNDQQKFKFRGIDAVVNAVGPALREVGGFITPKVIAKEYEHGATASGKPTVEVKLTVQYSWYGTDGGEPVVAEVASEAMDMSDKSTAKAMSVAYRTYLLQILMLPTDDPDPDSEYIERGAKKTPAKPVAENPIPGLQAKIARYFPGVTGPDIQAEVLAATGESAGHYTVAGLTKFLNELESKSNGESK